MLKRFVFAQEDRSGEAWLARFVTGRFEAGEYTHDYGELIP